MAARSFCQQLDEIMAESKMAFSADQIVSWTNHLLGSKFISIHELSTGAAFCKIVHKAYPEKINITRVICNARQTGHAKHNFKLLAQVLEDLGEKDVLDVDKLVRGQSCDILEFAQWLKKFYDIHNCVFGRGPTPKRFGGKKSNQAVAEGVGADSCRTAADSKSKEQRRWCSHGRLDERKLNNNGPCLPSAQQTKRVTFMINESSQVAAGTTGIGSRRSKSQNRQVAGPQRRPSATKPACAEADGVVKGSTTAIKAAPAVQSPVNEAQEEEPSRTELAPTVNAVKQGVLRTNKVNGRVRGSNMPSSAQQVPEIPAYRKRNASPMRLRGANKPCEVATAASAASAIELKSPAPALVGTTNDVPALGNSHQASRAPAAARRKASAMRPRGAYEPCEKATAASVVNAIDSKSPAPVPVGTTIVVSLTGNSPREIHAAPEVHIVEEYSFPNEASRNNAERKKSDLKEVMGISSPQTVTSKKTTASPTKEGGELKGPAQKNTHISSPRDEIIDVCGIHGNQLPFSELQALNLAGEKGNLKEHAPFSDLVDTAANEQSLADSQVVRNYPKSDIRSYMVPRRRVSKLRVKATTGSTACLDMVSSVPLSTAPRAGLTAAASAHLTAAASAQLSAAASAHLPAAASAQSPAAASAQSPAAASTQSPAAASAQLSAAASAQSPAAASAHLPAAASAQLPAAASAESPAAASAESPTAASAESPAAASAESPAAASAQSPAAASARLPAPSRAVRISALRAAARDRSRANRVAMKRPARTNLQASREPVENIDQDDGLKEEPDVSQDVETVSPSVLDEKAATVSTAAPMAASSVSPPVALKSAGQANRAGEDSARNCPVKGQTFTQSKPSFAQRDLKRIANASDTRRLVAGAESASGTATNGDKTARRH